MEGDDTKPSARSEKINHGIERISEDIQLPVALNADCLIGTLGRVSAALPHLGRNRRFDDLNQLPGGLDGAALALGHDELGNTAGPLLVGIVSDDPGEL